jgi:hypothetical protein
MLEDILRLMAARGEMKTNMQIFGERPIEGSV